MNIMSLCWFYYNAIFVLCKGLLYSEKLKKLGIKINIAYEYHYEFVTRFFWKVFSVLTFTEKLDFN